MDRSGKIRRDQARSGQRPEVIPPDISSDQDSRPERCTPALIRQDIIVDQGKSAEISRPRFSRKE